jgi:hypothetical protein
MQAKATTASAQSDQLALRPQGALMNWKKLLLHFFGYAATIFGMFSLGLWSSRELRFNVSYWICDAITALAIAAGVIGAQELNRGGHWKGRRLYWSAYYVVLGISFSGALYTKAPLGSALVICCILISAISLIPLPLALYLNRKQNKSTSQPATNNAS